MTIVGIIMNGRTVRNMMGLVLLPPHLPVENRGRCYKGTHSSGERRPSITGATTIRLRPITGLSGATNVAGPFPEEISSRKVS
ncbi:hypothetical protein E6H36_11155 [Candidatus Bathyarchaeota archaeon]|nr:MAG: hypothetical protein E6H36_11155 [Candidatus Bathyarchaeota archaeon]TMI30427.1 MAG: hypothetical protein E6H29_08765 [Candidatus Bathyarchaeota archaeon]